MTAKKRLARVEFEARGRRSFIRLWEAFREPFPSLGEVSGDSLWDLLDLWGGEETLASEARVKRIEEALDRADKGQWRGNLETTLAERRPEGEVPYVELTLLPYIGDRFFIAYRENGRCGVVCDYSQRPSISAADRIIEAVEAAEKDGSLIKVAWEEETAED